MTDVLAKARKLVELAETACDEGKWVQSVDCLCTQNEVPVADVRSVADAAYIQRACADGPDIAKSLIDAVEVLQTIAREGLNGDNHVRLFHGLATECLKRIGVADGE